MCRQPVAKLSLVSLVSLFKGHYRARSGHASACLGLENTTIYLLDTTLVVHLAEKLGSHGWPRDPKLHFGRTHLVSETPPPRA